MASTKEGFFVQDPDIFKPIQSIIAVIVLICLGSGSPVDGEGVLWFVTLCSLVVSTTATVLFMVNKDGLGRVAVAGGLVPWNVIEFVYSSILTLLCGVAFWLSFGYASHVEIGGHSAGYVFAGIFLIAQMVCYAIPTLLIYNRLRGEQHELIADIHPFGVSNDSAAEQRYQSAP